MNKNRAVLLLVTVVLLAVAAFFLIGTPAKPPPARPSFAGANSGTGNVKLNDKSPSEIANEFNELLQKSRTDANADERYTAAKKLIRDYCKDYPFQIFEHIRGDFEGARRTKLLELLFSQLAQTDPDKCKAMFEKLPPGRESGRAYLAFLQNASAAFFRDNLEWFEATIDNEIASDVAAYARQPLSGLTQEELTSLLSRSKNNSIKKTIAYSLGEVFAKTSGLDSLNSFSGSLSGAEKSAFLVAAYTFYSTSNQMQTLSYLFKSEYEADITKQVLPLVVGRATGSDPKSTIDSIASLRNIEIQKLALSVAMQTWLANSPLEASNYVKNMVPGLARNVAAERIARYALAKGDVEAANQWRSFINGQ